MPQVLMQLARHESIETTMKFYVGRNAEATADVLYEAVATARRQSDTFSDTRPAGDSGKAENPGKTKRTPQDSNLQPSVP